VAFCCLRRQSWNASAWPLARARKQAQRNLVEGLEQRTIAALEALIAVSDGRDRTALAWLRDWPEAPTQKNLVGVVERLQFVRSLGVGSDREQRIHRARYKAIAKETSILSSTLRILSGEAEGFGESIPKFDGNFHAVWALPGH